MTSLADAPVAHSQWTIRRRVLIGFGSVIALLFLTGVYGTVVFRGAQGDLQARSRRMMMVKNQLFASQEASRRYVVLAQNDLLRGGDKYLARMDSASDIADSLRTLLSVGDAMTDEQRAHLSQIGALQGRVGTRLAIARAHVDNGEPAEAAVQTEKAAALLDSLFRESKIVLDAEDDRATSLLTEAAALMQHQQGLVGTLLAVGLLTALLVGFLTVRAVTKPLDMLAAAARRMGEGNLRDAPDPSGLDEEYRVLAQALADTTTRLSRLVSAIQAEARDVANAADGLTVVSDAAAESTNRVSGTMADVARAAQEQRGAVESTRAVLTPVQSASDVLEPTAKDSCA